MRCLNQKDDLAKTELIVNTAQGPWQYTIAQLLTYLRDSWRIDVPWAGKPRTSTGVGDERGDDNVRTWRERRLTGVGDERGDNVHTRQRGDYWCGRRAR